MDEKNETNNANVDGGERDPIFALDERHLARSHGRTRGERLGGVSERKLAAILARLKMLWARQAQGRRVSRLDGETIFSDAEWAALGDSTLFARLGAGQGGGGDQGGGAPSQAAPPTCSSSSLARDSVKAAGEGGQR